MGRTLSRLLVVGVVCLASLGCVKKSTLRLALADLNRAELGIDTLEVQRQRLITEMEVEQMRRDSLESELHVAIARLDAEGATERGRVEEARRATDQIRTVLERQGSDYEALQRRLQSLAAVESEVRERNAIYEDVIARFRSLMDGGQLSVAIQRGRLVILLPQDVLFESGSATLGREGRTVIQEVATVLATFPDRSFQVEGHTDNVPIATERFPSNWELSSARALAVVRLLAQSGVAPENLSGAAYGENQPIESNDDRESRRRNRRIEIVMLPNLDVIAETPVGGEGGWTF